MSRHYNRPAHAGLFVFALAIGLALILLPFGRPLWADSLVKDGTGQPILIDQPPSRIVSLSPAHTDMLLRLQVGGRIVGVMGNSPVGVDAPSVGSVTGLDYERILAMQPDLILAWDGGTPVPWINRLRSMGLTVYTTRTRQLQDIARTLAALGAILGPQTAQLAWQLASKTEMRLQKIKNAGTTGARPVKVFYQVWHQPLMTINANHIISDAIRTCGGVNIFANLPALVPQVSRESVAAANPDLIVTSMAGISASKNPPELTDTGLGQWLALTRMDAVRHKRFLILDADKITRPGIGMLDDVERLCQAIANQR